ncbi:hypothetical protein [Catenovulum sediminis]|uniref:hypothetical protein n=1 Tax=Catenovulum sediminis TaxID=1740262 RepID=UPI00117CC8C1|nr:hypothetical protein [Catenovulum sediminis]
MLTKMIRTSALAALMVAAQSLLTACNQASAYSSDSTAKIPSDVLTLVNQTFQSNFVYGDWRFQGTQVINNSINAYIQIPDKLELSEKQQKQYIQMVICPSQDKAQMWLTTRDYPIWVHLYTHDKKYGVYAQCTNPHI